MRDVFAMMAEELEGSYLEVVKIPSQRGGYIRVAVSVNAEWYSAFCRRYMNSRRRYPKYRTIIKRLDTLNALRRLQAGNHKGVYAERLLDFVEYWYERMVPGIEVEFPVEQAKEVMVAITDYLEKSAKPKKKSSESPATLPKPSCRA